MSAEIPDGITIPALLRRGASQFGPREALVVDDARETYEQLLTHSLRYARAFTAAGLVPGDRVGLVMHNSVDLLHVLFGCSFARLTAVPINTRLSPRELAYIITDSGMAALVTGDHAGDEVDLVGRVTAALPGLDSAGPGEQGASDAAPALRHTFLLGRTTVPGLVGHGRVDELAAQVPEDDVLSGAEAIDAEDPYLMLYTSGTTAMPKGCVLPFRSIIKTGIAVGRSNFELTSDDRLWNPLPMFHVSAQAPLTGVLDAGGTYISTVHFKPAAALAQIKREQATVLFPAYPAIMQPLINDPEASADALSTARAVLNVGPPNLLAKFQDSLPSGTIQVSCYGSTESGGIAVMGRIGDSAPERLTSGKPLEGIELQIRDFDGRAEVPPLTKGVIWLRGYNLFTRYHNDPAKTAMAFDDQGWFNTEDLGMVDAGGALTFLGRFKDMLKVGGENVAAVEIETHLVSHPDVTLAAVVGRADSRLDEVPVAFVELAPGSSVTEEALIQHCRDGLAKFKVPREVHFVTQWPMSATKIQKFRLKEQLDQGTLL
ncbi:class I adenylate-forming enzyme family protein [Aeromicrobium sp. S22]|uniref:class I adenylate-forming enzyme family protein n=1 Tax=Aeromicrobium sp. S22 TaxID=2662029 RepID=UPI001892B5E2|nr:class I adenylate-forming enzyme family protein [Aeromicrobium sp. S22]